METAYHSDQDALKAYLPAPLAEQWARHPHQGPVWGAWLEGSLMFCDISGFTAMSENLARLGKEGAELMAGVLNLFFERMIALADGWGGSQMKFGGDAMLLFYSGEGHAQRAAAAGLEMQAAMAEFRHLVVGGDTYRLRMRIAIHSGRFFSASVGQPDGVLHYMLVGPDVNRTAEIEGAGDPGQVVLSTSAVAQIGPNSRLTPLKSGVSRIRALVPPTRPAPRESLDPPPRDILERYMLPPLVARLVDHRLPSLSGEHRRVTAVFINLLGISPVLEVHGEDQALTQADTYIKIAIEVFERHGGFLLGSDLAQEGDKLISLFGAPVSVEDGDASALRAALELDRQLAASGLTLRHRIGISAGSVFAGEIGSSTRREYTVIGDSVNLAARLMAAAKPGEILVSKPTIDRAGGAFEAQRLKPLRVKGKAAPVPVFRLASAASEPHQERSDDESIPLVGREEELDALMRLAGDVSSQSRLQAAYLQGDAGIGKSHLTAAVSRRLEAEGWQATWASCQMHTLRTPFAPWRQPLRSVLGIDAGDSVPAAAQKLYAAVARAAPEKALAGSMVGGLLGLPIEEDPSLSSLEPAERRGLLISLLMELIVAASSERPLLLLFEDAHWADSSSIELLAAILKRKEFRLFAIITSRIARPAPSLAEAELAVIHLRELPDGAARSLLASATNLSGTELERIVVRAQGNPLFLHEIARIGIVSGKPVPDNVNDVILARLDRLQQEEKVVLRLASVIGSTFNVEALHVLVAGSLDNHTVAKALEELQAAGFTRRDATESSSFFFSHVLTREVAYETLPYAQRRQLHRRAAQYIEGREAAREAICELLLYHYELAQDAQKVVRYAAMSGDRAAAVFATDQALDHYNLSLATLASLSRRFERDRSLILERLGDCLDTAGRHGDAAEMFIRSVNEWRVGRHRPRLVEGAPLPRPHEADLCRKVAVSYERRSDYDESLNWVNEAIRVLPDRAGLVGARVYATKSLALFRKGLYQHAILWGNRGLTVANRGHDLRQQAYAHHILSGSYRELGKLKQALHHDRLSARIYHELGDLPGQARSNSNLGLSYQMLGVLDAARYHYEIALTADERIANVSHASIVRNNIAEVLLVQGHLGEAETHLNEVIAAHRKGIARTALAGLAEVNLSRCSLRRADLEAAWHHVQRGLRLLKSVSAEGLYAEALLQRVELLLAENNPNQARRDVRRILKIVRELEAGVLETRAERLFGRAEAALGDDEASLSHLRESVMIAKRAGAGYEEALALIEIGRVLLARRNGRARAVQTLRRAASILTSMDAAIDLAEVRRLQQTE